MTQEYTPPPFPAELLGAPVQSGPEKSNRLRGLAERLVASAADPEMRAKVREIVEPYGHVALTGALEGAGLVKVDKSGERKVRKLGVIKAALRPTHTARKAVQGAFGGVRHEARSDIQSAVVRKGAELWQGRQSTPTAPSPELPSLPGTEDIWGPPPSVGRPAELPPLPTFDADTRPPSLYAQNQAAIEAQGSLPNFRK